MPVFPEHADVSDIRRISANKPLPRRRKIFAPGRIRADGLFDGITVSVNRKRKISAQDRVLRLPVYF